MSLIIEGATEKVLHLIMPQKSFGNVNCCFSEQNVSLIKAGTLRQEAFFIIALFLLLKISPFFFFRTAIMSFFIPHKDVLFY